MGFLKAVPGNNDSATPEELDPLEQHDDDLSGVESSEGESSASSFDSEEEYSSGDDTSYDSEIDDEAARLMAVLQEGAPSAEPKIPPKSPMEVLDEYMSSLETGKSTAIKMFNFLVSWILDLKDDENQTILVSKLFKRLITAIRGSEEIKHVILEDVLLQLFSPAQHKALYEALLDSRFESTITYWKLGSSGESTEASKIPTSILLKLLSTASFTAITELHIRGLTLDSPQQIHQLVQIVERSPTLKLFNLLDMVMSKELVATAGLLDPLIKAVGPEKGLDEVQLTRDVANDVAIWAPDTLPSLVSPSSLQHLFEVKIKWWRLALDGMGLCDEHLYIISSALQASPDCKMNDILSIRKNPRLTPRGLKHLYTVCIDKRRMGLVLSDDPSWVATFDLVRPLNNLHRRLDYKDPATGRYLSKDGWIDWLVILNNLPWLDDNRKLNYVWFTLLDQPDMVLASK